LLGRLSTWTVITISMVCSSICSVIIIIINIFTSALCRTEAKKSLFKSAPLRQILNELTQFNRPYDFCHIYWNTLNILLDVHASLFFDPSLACKSIRECKSIFESNYKTWKSFEIPLTHHFHIRFRVLHPVNFLSQLHITTIQTI
jgi:hypothetical protein